MVVGECGASKRQITFLGDVVNMTSRLEESCKTEDVDFLISDVPVNRIEPPAGCGFKPYKALTLKGTNGPFGVHRIVFE